MSTELPLSPQVFYGWVSGTSSTSEERLTQQRDAVLSAVRNLGWPVLVAWTESGSADDIG